MVINRITAIEEMLVPAHTHKVKTSIPKTPKTKWDGCLYNFSVHKKYVDKYSKNGTHNYSEYLDYQYHESRLDRCYEWAWEQHA